MSDVQVKQTRPVRMRFAGISRFLLISLALHIPLFIYPVLRLCQWLDLSWWLTLVVFLPLVSSQIITRFYLRMKRGRWVKLFRRLADFYLGISPIMLFTILFFEPIVGFGFTDAMTAAIAVIVIAGTGGLYATFAAMIPMVKKIELVSSKLSTPLRFAQITDVHIGSRQSAFLDRVIHEVNKLKPDFLCVTGDLIDGYGVSEDELKSLKSVVGPVYFTIGNHEKYEDLQDIISRLTNLGVSVLRNADARHCEQLQVIGIDDMDDASQVARQLQKITIDPKDFVLLLYHRPRGLIAAAEAGVDLMLSGHTHNGQIMPFNLVVNRVFDKMNGLYEHGNTKLYVSQGTGTWGPVMRLGTRSEITLFEINPG